MSHIRGLLNNEYFQQCNGILFVVVTRASEPCGDVFFVFFVRGREISSMYSLQAQLRQAGKVVRSNQPSLQKVSVCVRGGTVSNVCL